jgi:hypothetical protein
MNSCLQVIVNKFEAPGHYRWRLCLGWFFIFFKFSFLSHWIRPSSWWMGLCLQFIFNEFEAPGHCRNVQCLGCFFLEFFFFHSLATGLGPAADWWACDSLILRMTWRPLGTAGTGSVWDVFIWNFFLSQAIGLGPAADWWAHVCNFFSMNLKPLQCLGCFFHKFFSHSLATRCNLDAIDGLVFAWFCQWLH